MRYQHKISIPHKNSPFDLPLSTNKNFRNDDTYASLKPLFASSFVQKIKKKLMKKSGDILKDSVFWTNFDLMTPILGTKSCSK